MNEQNVNSLRTMQDVYFMLRILYSTASAKVYEAAFRRAEKLTGRRMSEIPVDEAEWARIVKTIVWAGEFTAETPEAAERAFQVWADRFPQAVRRARTVFGLMPDRPVETTKAWDEIEAYIREAEKWRREDGSRIVPNMAHLSVANLRARIGHAAPWEVATHAVSEAMRSMPADNAAKLRRSCSFFNGLIMGKAHHGPIADLLPDDPIGPLPGLRDAPIKWSLFTPEFRQELEGMIRTYLIGGRRKEDRFEGRLGSDPLGDRRAARARNQRPIRNKKIAEKAVRQALSWLVRHAFEDRDEAYALAGPRDLLTRKSVERAAERYIARARNSRILINPDKTASGGSYLARLATFARRNEFDEDVVWAVEDARDDAGVDAYQLHEMSASREAFVKLVERDAEIARAIVTGARRLWVDAARGFARWDSLSVRQRSETLHLSMASSMLALQLSRALRSRNLNELTSGGRYPELIEMRRGDPAWLDLARDRVKNRRPIEGPVPESQWIHISSWLSEGRPRWVELHGVAIESLHLFPGVDGRRAISRGTFNKVWNRGMRRLGLAGLTPHMMRHVTATLYLAKHPGDYATVAAFLGDSVRTVEQFYARGAGAQAMRMFAEVLEALDPTLADDLGRRAA